MTGSCDLFDPQIRLPRRLPDTESMYPCARAWVSRSLQTDESGRRRRRRRNLVSRRNTAAGIHTEEEATVSPAEQVPKMERERAGNSGQVRCRRRNKEREAPKMGPVPVSAAPLTAGRGELAAALSEKEQNSQGRQRMGDGGRGGKGLLVLLMSILCQVRRPRRLPKGRSGSISPPEAVVRDCHSMVIVGYISMEN